MDDGITVQFYSSDDCPSGTELSSADCGSIEFDSPIVGAYQSFRAIHTSVQSRREEPVNMSFHKRRQGSNAALTTPDPFNTAQEPAAFHGMTASFDGIEYRWHQVAPGTWVGIVPEKWDDNIHVMNNVGRLGKPGNTSTIPRPVLDDRDLLQGLCRTATRCLGRAKAGTVVLLDVVELYFDKLKPVMQQSGRDAWEFLSSGPFYQQILTSKFKSITLCFPAAPLFKWFLSQSYAVLLWNRALKIY